MFTLNVNNFSVNPMKYTPNPLSSVQLYFNIIYRTNLLPMSSIPSVLHLQIFSSTTHPAEVVIAESRIAASQGITIDGQDRSVEQSIDNGVRLKLENNVIECEAECYE